MKILHYFTLRKRRKKPNLSEFTQVLCGLLSLLPTYLYAKIKLNLLSSPFQPFFGLNTQCSLFPARERVHCMSKPNNGCERNYTYCRSSNREYQNYLSTVNYFKNVIPNHFTTKTNWNFVVSPIDPNQRYIILSNESGSIEQEKRIIFQRLLHCSLSGLCPLCVICDNMKVAYKEHRMGLSPR